MTFEVLPPIPQPDLTALKIERLVVDVDDESITKALEEIADRNIKYEVEDGRAASNGDMVTMDFLGRIDGVAFDGGAAEGATLVIGKGQFIPGFEEGATGIKAGEERVVVHALSRGIVSAASCTFRLTVCELSCRISCLTYCCVIVEPPCSTSPAAAFVRAARSTAAALTPLWR